MVVMAAVYAQWYSVSGGLGGQQTYTEAQLGSESWEARSALSPFESDARAQKGFGVSIEHTGSVPEARAETPQPLPIYFPPTLYPMKENLQPTPTIERFEAKPLIAASVSGQLTEAEMRVLLAEAGWPAELIPQALAVSWCESKWSPGAIGDSGRSVGLFQVNAATWFPYAGEDASQWADPLVNARVAWRTYQYDIGRGYESWRQWSCKP